MRHITYLLLLIAGAAFTAEPSLQQSPDAVRVYDAAAREAQYQSLLALPPSIDVEYGAFGRIRRLEGPTGLVVRGARQLKPREAATAIFAMLRPMLLATGKESLAVQRVSEGLPGEIYVQTTQSIDGIPVVDAFVNITLNKKEEIVGVHARFASDLGQSKSPSLSYDAAVRSLKEILISEKIATAPKIEVGAGGSLAYWSDEGKIERPRLIWIVQASYINREGQQQVTNFGVDSETGAIRHWNDQIFHLNRTVYSLGGGTNVNLPSWPQALTLLWNEGASNPSEQYGFSIYSIYQKVVGSVSAWNVVHSPMAYQTINLVAHHGVADYAAWLGSYSQPYLVFGNNRALDADVVAHEYGHGVYVPWAPPKPPGMKYWDQWYAINEFYADLSAIYTDLHVDGSSDYRVSNVRYLDNPRLVSTGFRDWYPSRRFAGLSDVAYSNATIFGHAMYLMPHGGQHARAGQQSDLIGGDTIPSINVSPIASGSAVANIFATALRTMQQQGQTMNGETLASATIAAANALYGSAHASSVQAAWAAVGIGFQCSGPPAKPAPTFTNYFCMGRYDVNWSQVPGATYHAELGSTIRDWSLTGISVTDGRLDSCSVQAASYARFRMRACNGCGCSDWTPDYYMQYYSPCL